MIQWFKNLFKRIKQVSDKCDFCENPATTSDGLGIMLCNDHRTTMTKAFPALEPLVTGVPMSPEQYRKTPSALKSEAIRRLNIEGVPAAPSKPVDLNDDDLLDDVLTAGSLVSDVLGSGLFDSGSGDSGGGGSFSGAGASDSWGD